MDFMKQAKPVLILIGVCAALIAGVAIFFGGGSSGGEEVELTNSGETLPAPLNADLLEVYDVDITSGMNPIAVLNTNKGVIEVELYENQMPITAGNFAKLVDEGFYDGVKFHRIIEGFMIQGGDPLTKTDQVLVYGTGDPGYSIPDEHIRGELLTNVRGTLSMANSGPNTGGSQFFINLVDNLNLDFDKPPLQSQHPVFGRVVAGMDIVDTIARVETNERNLPLEDVVIESATVRRES